MSLPLPPANMPAPVSPGSGHAHAASPSTTLSTSSVPNAVDNSLQALVEETERKSASANERMAAPPPHTSPNPSYPDAVDLHIIGMLEAEQLFDLFHEHLNPFIKLFDRRLHTASWVRQSSPVLFTSLLAVSAKFHRPAVYPTLLTTAQQLVTRGIADGLPASHIGLVQSICVLVYWKEPSVSAGSRFTRFLRHADMICRTGPAGSRSASRFDWGTSCDYIHDAITHYRLTRPRPAWS